MKRRPFRWPVIASIVGSCLFCFAAQACLWDYLVAHGARLVSANTYTIFLSRLQNASMLKGDTMILGSSLTERLMPSGEIASIGVPASCFLAGMQFVNYDNFAPGSVFVLEANNVFNGVNEAVMEDTRKLGHRLFRGNPHFSIAAMPSSLLLSAAYFVTGSYTAALHEKGVLTESALEPLALDKAAPLTEAERASYAELRRGIEDLRARGYRVCLAYLPEEERTRRDGLMPRMMSFAREMDVPLLDYTESPFVSQLSFTSNNHLDSKKLSTTLFRNTLARDARNCAR